MIRLKIQKELLKIGYNPLHIWTKYLAEAIYIIYENNKSIYKINLEKEIYKKLALKYEKNMQTIKSNIVKTTNSIDIKNNPTISNSLKITPKLAIWFVMENIKNGW